MKYISTNRNTTPVSFGHALLQGQATDLGLFVPETIPSLPAAQIAGWAHASYAQIAIEMLTPFVKEEIPHDALAAICEDAYNFEIPLEPVDGGHYVMRLDRGPTASFKDFAARAMARMMSFFLQQQQRQLYILTATSGDTGSAIAHAFYEVPGIQVTILFPRDEVSTRQRKQMTTLGKNIHVLAVDGKFDDCQAMVKRAFSDPQLEALPLSSANSINIGRLLPQSVYYAYAYSRVAKDHQPMLCSIPCGNFGNMMGAIFAWRMGLPLQTLIIAVNENDEVPKFLDSGKYEKIEPSRNCLSNAMNVGHPSNFARLVHMYGGHIDHKGQMFAMPDMEQMRKDLFGLSVTDEQTRQTIVQAYKQQHLLLEPHGAVAWHGLQTYLAKHPEHAALPAVSVETAHPAKFPDAIQELLGFEPDVPPALATIEQKTETFDSIPHSYEAFRSCILDRF